MVMMMIGTGRQEPTLMTVLTRVSRTALAMITLSLAGAVLTGPSQAQNGTARIISTPVATNFAKGVSKALNSPQLEISEMNSVPALELMCAAKTATDPIVVLSAMTITPAMADQCVANGISALTEAQLGFLTLVMVQKSNDPPFVLPQHPLEAGTVRGFGMRSLYHLRQLPGIAHEDDVPGRAPHRGHVGKPHLPRFVDEQPVEILNVVILCQKESRSADDPAA